MHLFRNAEMSRLAFTTGQESERIVKSWERNDLMTMMCGIHTKMVNLMCFHTWRCNYKIVVCTELILESDFFASKIPKRCKVEVTGNMPMPGGGSSVIVDKPFEVWYQSGQHKKIIRFCLPDDDLSPDRCRKIYRSSQSKGTGFGGDDRHRELDFVEVRFINWIPIVDPADWCVWS